MNWNVDVFQKVKQEWALLTAGPREHCNAMTVSWGSFGTLWNKPVVTVYVKPVRYTHSFLCDSEWFTLSFFGKAYREDLLHLGTVSGRDGDKFAGTSLTPTAHGQAVVYPEAEITLVCRKRYRLDMAREGLPEDAVKTYYETEELHTMFVGEVVEILRNEN